MINIEKIKKQSDDLIVCINNYESAIQLHEIFSLSPTSIKKEIDGANDIINRCEQTLIGQLKLMNIQNYELLK